MAKNPVKIVIDTNILISALGFGGKPRTILENILDNKIKAVTSSILLAELEDVINKKFPKLAPGFPRIRKLFRKKFDLIHPMKSINILTDEPDNRVLEAAYEGNCDYIVTGDKELLRLKTFKKIQILSASEFLKFLR